MPLGHTMTSPKRCRGEREEREERETDGAEVVYYETG